jgi:Protein kinase domain
MMPYHLIRITKHTNTHTHNKLHTQCDVWACGVLAYELIVGRPPFEVKDEVQTRQRIMHDTTLRLPSSVSPEAVSFIRTALAKNSGARPTASELLGHPWLRPHLLAMAASSGQLDAATLTCVLPPLPHTHCSVVLSNVIISQHAPAANAATQPPTTHFVLTCRHCAAPPCTTAAGRQPAGRLSRRQHQAWQHRSLQRLRWAVLLALQIPLPLQLPAEVMALAWVQQQQQLLVQLQRWQPQLVVWCGALAFPERRVRTIILRRRHGCRWTLVQARRHHQATAAQGWCAAAVAALAAPTAAATASLTAAAHRQAARLQAPPAQHPQHCPSRQDHTDRLACCASRSGTREQTKPRCAAHANLCCLCCL